MQIWMDPPEIHAGVREFRRAGRTIGLVPTMGALHEGHRKLLETARAENDIALASIYVNPLQFGPHEDFARYPRTLEADLDLCRDVGLDAVLTLREETMRPREFATFVDVMGVSDGHEGARRPGHFRGVATIVMKLLGLTSPDRLYLGQKDAQQVVVIARMVADLNLATQVVVCPIVREADGLALSSRNRYLSAEERAAAPAIAHGLKQMVEVYSAGERDLAALRGVAVAPIACSPLLTMEYAEWVAPRTFTRLDRHDLPAEPVVFVVAVQVGSTRLLDNQILPPHGSLV